MPRQLRAFFRGHFFFVVLFGAAAGDVAKSAVYARWYQFRMAEVLAAAPLDRFFGYRRNNSAGPGCYCFGYGEWRLSSTGEAPFAGPGSLALDTLGPNNFALCLLVWWAPQGEAAWKRTIQTFRAGVLRLTRHAPAGCQWFLFSLFWPRAL